MNSVIFFSYLLFIVAHRFAVIVGVYFKAFLCSLVED